VRSVTFAIGIILAVAAFCGYLLLGGFLAPPPYQVVVAIQDIPPYTPLNASMLGVDSQHLNSQVVRTLVQKDELDQYLGGFVTTPIYAGEPLRKASVVSPSNPQGADRLSLVMKDPQHVAMVIPVDPKTAPSQIVAGDYVDLVIGLAAGNIPVSGANNPNFNDLLTNPSNGASPSSNGNPIPTISPIFKSNGIGATSTISGLVAAGDMNLPLAKAVVRDVPVLATNFQKVPNPAYASSGNAFGGSDQQVAPQPAYTQGDIQSLTVSIPRGSEELVKFGLDNGKVNVVLLPLQSAEEANANNVQDPTLGISWNDVLALLIKERTQALQAAPTAPAANSSTSGSVPTQSTSPTTPTPTTIARAATVTTNANSTPTPSGAVAGAFTPPSPEMTTVPEAPVNAPRGNTIPTGLDWGAIVTPLLCGFVLLILLVVAIRFIRSRRRQNALV
jgi:SAF domain